MSRLMSASESLPDKESAETRSWSRAFRVLSAGVILFLGTGALWVTFASEKFEYVYSEMLGPAALPVLTQLIFTYRGVVLALIAFSMIAGTAGTFALKHRGAVVTLSILLPLLQIIGIILLICACFLPFATITTEMGHQSL